MSFDPYEFDRSYGSSARGLSEGEYTARTFLWMVLGLMVTPSEWRCCAGSQTSRSMP